MRILLVDDDPSIVTSLMAVLRNVAGHEVRSALTGEAALAHCSEMGGVDVLITDVVMDPMDGFTLRDHVVSQYPDARTILITGFDLSDYPEQTQNHQLLQKPFDPAALIEALQKEAPGQNFEIAAPAVAPEPVAVPIVVAAAPVEVAPAIAVPVAEPAPVAATAVPVAVPKAVPVVAAAAAAAVPAVAKAAVAAASAAPTARAAQPVQVAKAGARPGQPVPVPRAAAGAVAKAVRSQPVPSAVPVPAAQPAAVPVARAQPAAVPVAKAQPAAVPAVPPVPPPADSGPSLVGTTIGAYKIEAKLGEGQWGTVYAAVQTAINRRVGLKILSADRAKDDEAKQRFIADARAKAHVQNPSILAVYEAGEEDGHIFYTHEFVDGRNMAEIQARNEKLDEATALKVLRVAAEGLAYYQTQNIPHAPLDAGGIYIGADNHPRLANRATHLGEQQQPFEQEMQTLGRILLGVLRAGPSSMPGLRGLLGKMVQSSPGSPSGFASWSALLLKVKEIEPQVVPVKAAEISASDRAAIAAVEAAKKSQKRTLYLTIGSMVSLVLLVLGVLYWVFIRNAERSHDEMVLIPAGDFLFQNGEPVSLPDFWIDKYEVTIGQYAEFLKAMEKSTQAEREKIDHPTQPPTKRGETGHVPATWKIYYDRARQKMQVAGTPTSLDSPVVDVDWWDAFAYARWKGCELPSEKEWEKAARGTKGFLYPWGEEFDPKKANTGADYHGGNPQRKAEFDGYIRYGDVDKQLDDKSPYGVVGMCGNVAEWTGDWVEQPAKRQRFPVIKGGSFMTTDVKLDRRVIDLPASTHTENLGFRTVRKTAPPK